MQSRNHESHAFTLIELLTVVALVALLASLVLPALDRAKRAAQLAQCQNNVRQIALRTAMYASENGAFPLGGIYWRYPGMAQSLFTIEELSGPCFICPAERKPSGMTGREWEIQNEMFLLAAAYGDNLLGMSTLAVDNMPLGTLGLGEVLKSANQITFKDGGYPQAESAVVAPADMIAMGDAFAEVRGDRGLQGAFGFNFESTGQINGVDSEQWARIRHNAELVTHVFDEEFGREVEVSKATSIINAFAALDGADDPRSIGDRRHLFPQKVF